MKASFAIAAVFAARIYKATAQAEINTSGTPSSCGNTSCCIPECILNWTDSEGCDGQASIAGSCSNAFFAADDTSDTGVDICNGAGAFFCATSAGGRAIFVANTENVVSAALFPATYTECNLGQQCAGCATEGGCEAPVAIGTSTTHSCSAFNALLASSGVSLATC